MKCILLTDKYTGTKSGLKCSMKFNNAFINTTHCIYHLTNVRLSLSYEIQTDHNLHFVKFKTAFYIKSVITAHQMSTMPIKSCDIQANYTLVAEEEVHGYGGKKGRAPQIKHIYV